MDGLIITGDSYGPSPVSGGAPSPPLMIEGPRRPPSAPVGRRIDPYGESQRITSPSLITAVGHRPSAATWCPPLSPLTHLTSFFHSALSPSRVLPFISSQCVLHLPGSLCLQLPFSCSCFFQLNHLEMSVLWRIFSCVAVQICFIFLFFEAPKNMFSHSTA